MNNLVPERYRQVTVAFPEEELTAEALTRFLMGREVYRRTAYVVARRGDETALVAVEKESEEPLFSPVTSVELKTGPDDTVYVVDPDVDCGNPTQLSRVAARYTGHRCVVVEGRYNHVSFILDAKPLRILVRDVVPPHPAKLLDQATMVLDIAEELPPLELVGDIVDTNDLIGDDTDILLPCMGAGEELPGVTVNYLDQVPERRDWKLVGCERSLQIHKWFYGDTPPTVDFCPRNRPDPDGYVLAKCCLIEEGMQVRRNSVFVPWGSDLAIVREGLAAVVKLASEQRDGPQADDADTSQ